MKFAWIFFALLCVLPFTSAAPNTLGCCLNPNAYDIDDDLFCSAEQIIEAQCCPLRSSNPSYYSSSAHPYGPNSETECASNYFEAGVDCSAFTQVTAVDKTTYCLEGCCCTSSSNLGIMPKGVCLAKSATFYQSTIDCNSVCAISSTPTPSSSCSDSLYQPVISNVAILPRQGEKAFEITWTDSCRGSYTLTRCLKGVASSCVDVGLGVAGTSFIDSRQDLLFDTVYSYQIKGSYAVQGAVPNSKTYDANLGNLECWGHTTSDKFCLGVKDYRVEPIKSYLMSTIPGITESTFDAKINQLYKAKLNTGDYCSRSNILTKVKTCTGTDICAVQNAEPMCVKESKCTPDLATYPLGFLFDQQACYGLGYCYYDSGVSVDTKCYSCQSSMSCMDYKSKNACEQDVCSASRGICEWRDTIPELGLGLCVDTNDNNCQWCGQDPPASVAKGSYNSLLQACSVEKANTLSTVTDQCYFAGPTAYSCASITCNSIALVDCPTIAPALDQRNNVLSASIACSLTTCQQFSGKCVKNADADTASDCALMADVKGCEADLYPPDTLMSPIDDDGITVGLLVSRSDRTGQTVLYNANHTTLFCVDPQGNCLAKAATQYGLSTSQRRLAINGLRLSEWDTDRQITLLREGFNTIYYYSIDQAKNLGIVGNITVEAHANNARPDLYLISMNNQTPYLDGIIYHNSRTPSIELGFRNPGAQLTTLEIRNKQGQIIADLSSFMVSPTPSVGVFNYLLTPLQLNFSAGNYTLFVNAINSNNRPLRNSQQNYKFSVDFSTVPLKITPSSNATTLYLTKISSVPLLITAPRDVQLENVYFDGVDHVADFTTGYSLSFAKTYVMPDGTKTVTVNAHDRYGNSAQATVNFIVNAIPDTLRLVSPPNGASSAMPFDIVLSSQNDLNCKYSWDFQPSISEFSYLADFSSVQGPQYTLRGVNLADQNVHKLYVLCKELDQRPDPYSFVFDIRYDNRPPLITSLYTSPPSPLAELPVNFSLIAVGDEEVQCRYSFSSSDAYAQMSNFDNFSFQTRKATSFVLTSSGIVTYYVQCEDRSGQLSTPTSLAVTVDTSLPLRIIDHTDSLQATASPIVAIETNKRAACRYDFIDPQVTVGRPFGTQDSYSHSATLLVNLSSSSYTVYVRCFRSGESILASTRFTIDTTPPVMKYVNDTNPTFGQITPLRDSIYVSWLGEDIESGSRGLRYNYTLYETLTRKAAINWTTGGINIENNNGVRGWIKLDELGRKLNLTDQTGYSFEVKAINSLGLSSASMKGQGVTTDFSKGASLNGTCSNNVKDSSETDVDCGGGCGSTCDEDDLCERNADCSSRYCASSGRCAAPICDDETRNGNETDVDCGGDDCDACTEGDKCKSDSDCETGSCRSGLCSKRDTCSDYKITGTESDVDCGGACSTRCTSGKLCYSSDDCSTGLSCSKGKCAVQESNLGKDSDKDGIPDSWETSENLDPQDASDAGLDFDDDGLSNLQEYQWRTKPNTSDTDGDGVSDGIEVGQGSDPLDPSDSGKKEGGSTMWLWILLILLVVVVLGTVAYLVYFQPKKKPMPMTPLSNRSMGMTFNSPPPLMPRKPALRPLTQKKLPLGIFDAFSKKEEPKPSAKAAEPEQVEEPVVSDSKDSPKQKKQSSDDVFKKLSALVGDRPRKKEAGLTEVTEQLRKEFSAHREHIEGKLDTIEKKVTPKATLYYSTPAGKRYHRRDCITLTDKKGLKEFESAAKAKAKGLKPCNVCSGR